MFLSFWAEIIWLINKLKKTGFTGKELAFFPIRMNSTSARFHRDADQHRAGNKCLPHKSSGQSAVYVQYVAGAFVHQPTYQSKHAIGDIFGQNSFI